MLAESAYKCALCDLFDAMYFAIFVVFMKVSLFRMTPPVQQRSAI